MKKTKSQKETDIFVMIWIYDNSMKMEDANNMSTSKIIYDCVIVRPFASWKDGSFASIVKKVHHKQAGWICSDLYVVYKKILYSNNCWI